MRRGRGAEAVGKVGEAAGLVRSGGAVGRSFPPAESVLDLLADAGRQMTFEIKGTSMAPLLTPGDRVTVQPVPGDKMKRGDVIVFMSGGQVVVHRLIGKCRRAGTTLCRESGDNSGNWSWIREEAVVGRVVSFAGRGRRADMDGLPWRWVNPVMGMSRAGWFAFDTLLRKVHVATLGNGLGGEMGPRVKRALANVLFPLSGGIFRCVLARFAGRRAPGGRDE